MEQEIKNISELSEYAQVFIGGLKRQTTHATIVGLSGELGAGKHGVDPNPECDQPQIRVIWDAARNGRTSINVGRLRFPPLRFEFRLFLGS